MQEADLDLINDGTVLIERVILPSLQVTVDAGEDSIMEDLKFTWHAVEMGEQSFTL